MKQAYATTRNNIVLLSHLLKAVQHIITADPLILTAGISGSKGHHVHLNDPASDPDFFDCLDVPFIIEARDSDLWPWQAVGHHAGLAVFKLLDDDELRDDFYLDPRTFDDGLDHDPGEHFMDSDGRPPGHEDEQHQAEVEINAQGVTT